VIEIVVIPENDTRQVGDLDAARNAFAAGPWGAQAGIAITDAIAVPDVPRPGLFWFSAAAGQALAEPEVKDKLRAIGLIPVGSTPDALTAELAANTAFWQPIVKATG
jgi:tripartite-type tricarboxylate transporter receptor subunit TctC